MAISKYDLLFVLTQWLSYLTLDLAKLKAWSRDIGTYLGQVHEWLKNPDLPSQEQ